MSTYLDAQLGIGEESTFGTRVAASRFFEFTTESLKLEIDRIWSNAIRSGRRTRHRVHPGAQRVVGDFEVELAPQGIGLLLKHLFGAVNTTGTNPYTHTFTPGVLDGKSLTIQVGRTDLGGTTRPFDYLGCKIPTWELSAALNALAMLKCSVYGVHEDTGQSLVSVTYPTGWSPFVFTHGSLTLAAAATDIREFRLAADNGLDLNRHRISATTPSRSKEPKEVNVRNYSGSLVCDWNGLTDYNRFVNGTEAAVVLTFNAGASAQLVITLNVEFDGETPTVDGRNVNDLPLPFTVLHATADASAITAALTNADSAP